MRTLICTAGTSVAERANPLSRHASPDVYRDAMNQRVETLRRELPDPKAFLARVSAETNSLQAFRLNRDDRVVLLHTETPDGLICAEKIADLLSPLLDQPARLRQIKGLQVTDAVRFRREGIQNLIAALDDLNSAGAADNTDVILNVTGGFKGVVPYVTLYGLLKQLPVVYLFEQSSGLIHLPPAPISFDYERLARARVALQAIQRRIHMPREEFYKAIPGLDYHERQSFEPLLEDAAELGKDQVTLSPFGLLFASDAQAEVAEVFLSPNAQRQFEQSQATVREQFAFMLQRVGDPLWRRGKQHNFAGTDLAVFKPGNTSERMACIIRDRRIYVCELLRHDEYERVLPTRKQHSYQIKQFTAWTPPPDLSIPQSDQEIVSRLQAENLALQNKADTAETGRKTAADELASMSGPLRELLPTLEKLVARLNRFKKPAKH